MSDNSVTNRFLILFFISLLTFSVNCNSNELKLSIEVKKIELWLNLMPGGPGSFHLASEVKIKNNENRLLKNFKASNVSIFQSGNLIYSFNPTFETESGNSNHLDKNEEKIYLITNVESLPINNDLDPNLFVEIFITFQEETGKLFVQKIEKVKVEKVY